MITENFLYQ